MLKIRPVSRDKYEIASWILIVIAGIMLIANSFLGPLRRSETENNEIPIFSIQYRGSIFLSNDDLEHMEEDMPELYETFMWGQRGHEDNVFWRMPQVSEDEYYYTYFPIYPLLSLPVKLLFQALSVDQERCFTVTNALMILLALIFVQKKLKVSSKQRFLAVALLAVSPLYYQVNFVYYMAVMFSLVTMSLVQYCNGRYKSSALLLSIASMANSTIMAVGIVMVAEYLIKTVRLYRRSKNAGGGGYILHAVGYGLCYIPSLVQFVINWIIGAEGFSPFGFFADSKHYLARVFAYLFDPTLGFTTFAPLTIVVFLVLVVVGVFKKRYHVLVWGGFLLGAVGAFSIMFHINSDMHFFARYLVFTWPIIPLFLATEGYEMLKPVTARRLLYPLMLLSSCFLLYVNAPTALLANRFNPETEWLLNNVPQLYTPYSATFYCRALLGAGGGYDITYPVYYSDPETDEVRKLIYKADEGQAEQVLSDLTGDEASMAYLEEKLDKHGTDGKYHYINFSPFGKYQVREATPEDLGEVVSGPVVVEEHDFLVGNAGRGLLMQFPLEIKAHTVYRVEITLAEDVDFRAALRDGLVLDFYAGPDYDQGEQEAGEFVKYGGRSYTFYFDSGDVGGEALDGMVRAFTLRDMGGTVQVDTLRVTEMERVE